MIHLFNFASAEVREGVVKSYVPFALAQTAAQDPGGLTVYVTTRGSGFDTLEAGVRFADPQIAFLNFPGWDCLPYDRVSPHKEVMQQRMKTLQMLKVWQPGQTTILCLALSSLVQRVPHSGSVNAPTVVEIGQEWQMPDLLAALLNAGYARTGVVREPGEFAVRGGLVDVYPGSVDAPVRIDLMGDLVEGMRSFDPLTQRSLDPVKRVVLSSGCELTLDDHKIDLFKHGYRTHFGSKSQNDPLYQAISDGRPFPGMEHWTPLFHHEMSTLFDYLPPQTQFVFDAEIAHHLAAHYAQIQDYYQARLQAARGDDCPYRALPPESLYMAPATLQEKIATSPQILYRSLIEGDGFDQGSRQGHSFAAVQKGGVGTLYTALGTVAAQAWESGQNVMLTAYTAGSRERLSALLRSHDLAPIVMIESASQLPRAVQKSFFLALVPLEKGFRTPTLLTITEEDLLGHRLARPQRRATRPDLFIAEATALNRGDLLVHQEHGVGRFVDLKTIDVGQAPHDCVCVEYAGGDKLFIPVESLEILSRFGGQDADHALDKLGGASWQARKAKAKSRIQDIAASLVQVAAARALHQGDILGVDPGPYEEFCARFPYPETPDQDQAISDVIADMSSGKPMDRLICGDVGFGKTEVALRAAFIAAAAGKQVAVIAPTTLLARQHYLNFKQRFEGFGMGVGHLSRLVGTAERKQVREDLASGACQILVGTHAVLAKDIAFQDLGLVIVDEEQRFGVVQKERLKALRTEIHILTLTATPIPRTLQMALSGVREMSLLATPPIDRLSVHTYVMPYDGVVTREALMREHYRGGQSFYICPRIEDLTKVYAQLQTLVPELKVVSAHGQMPAQTLESVMLAFDAGSYDVLLATNIVESGIDIPNANTLIVHRSDMYGLAQLYQIRGRIGRGKRRGYAYLTIPADRPLNPEAQRRLEVMQTLDSLGAGFQLASHDLDIRGGGNIVGDEQSGHIREVGVELYQQMLEDAIAACQSQGATIERWVPQLNLGIPVMIPESYVPDLSARMQLYRRLSHFDSPTELEHFATELIDRFGSLPEEVKNLLDVVLLKQLCRAAGVERVDAGAKGILLHFYQGFFIDPLSLIAYAQRPHAGLKVRPDSKLAILSEGLTDEARLNRLRQVLQDIADIATKAAKNPQEVR